MLTKEQIEGMREHLMYACANLPTAQSHVNTLADAAEDYLQACEQEPVGTVQPLHELNDVWMQKLPVGTKLFAAPVPVKEATC